MIILVIGGSKSGKSDFSEKIAYKIKKQNISSENLYYLATMNCNDCEDENRINEHINKRHKYNFTTIEKKTNISKILDKFNYNDVILLDSITALATNEMFNKNNINLSVYKKIFNDIKSLSTKTKNLVLVSDYVFSDSTIYDDFTNNFRKELGNLNCSLASISDIVIELSFGNTIYHKGESLFYETII